MADTKAKKLCYERRAACIMKKAMELQILCGLKIGVVILSPDGKLESWPPQLNDVKALLDACKERGPRVKSDKRKEDPTQSCREILVSKLSLLNQREESFKSAKGKEIASTKKRKGFSEGCLEILDSKLELLKKREMVFLNRSGSSASDEGNEFVSVEGIESHYDGAVVAYGQEGDVLTQNLGPLYDDLGDKYTSIDEFFSFEEDKTDNLVANPKSNGTFKGKEIATMENMDSGILQYTTHLGAYQCDENGEQELTSMNNGISNKGLAPNQWHHGSSSANHTLQACSVRFEAASYPPLPLQSSFTALGNGLPAIAAQECGELQARKKARLQNYSTAALNNNLPIFTSTEYWETMLTNAGLVDSTHAMMSLLDDF